MVTVLQRIAWRLRPLTPLAVVLAAAGLATFGWSVLSADGDRVLIPGLLCAVWGAWLFTLITGFSSLQPPPDPAQPWRLRLRRRLAWAGYRIMAAAVIGGGLAAAFLTLRLLVLWGT